MNQEKTYNWTDVSHKPPFNNEYYSKICTKNCTTELIRMTVGNNGSFLKFLTEKYNMCYIFHNIETGCFEIWGSENKHNIIHDLIVKKIQEIDIYLNNNGKEWII